MGPQRTEAFDAELRALLTPYAVAGTLTYEVRTTLTYGRLALTAFVP